jgi:hypothetical protein
MNSDSGLTARRLGFSMDNRELVLVVFAQYVYTFDQSYKQLLIYLCQLIMSS